MKILENLILRIYASPGSHVSAVCADLCDLAGRMGTPCEADFNGVKLLAYPSDNPDILARSYFHQVTKTDGHRIATA